MKNAALGSALVALLTMVSIQACGSSKGEASSSEGGTGGGGTCPSAVAADPLATERAACTFTTGAMVKDTLGIDPATQAALPIKHVIVMMKENRAFDHLLGQLHTQGQPDTEAIPATFTNPSLANVPVAPFHQTSTCIPYDPDHQWAAMHAQVDEGAMDGFVQSAGTTTGTNGYFAMSWYENTDFPFYYFLASTYALNDRHFASVRSGTFPNRNFLLLGTADGIQSTGDGYPAASTPTIFEALTTAGVTWGVYSDGSLLSGTLNWNLTHPNTGLFSEFLQLLDAGTLPQVTFVDGIDNVQDDHPTANIQVGEAWSKEIYDHAIASPLWPGMAILWTYDEAGGFADHVPPPNHACVARPGNSLDTPFFELGVRIPMVVISPYARPGYVSHVVQEHTALTRFIETVFDLPALTARDANSDALLDMFDFSCEPTFLKPPTAPAAGTKGCFGSIVLTTDMPTYQTGESIQVSFTGAPGTDGKDWIAVYTYPATGATAPNANSLAFAYIDGTQTAGASPMMGTVTIDAASVNPGMGGMWPLPAGGYIAYYLLDGGYTQAASIDFTVQ
jgi:phospholipase C